jgi:hypothetical protein
MAAFPFFVRRLLDDGCAVLREPPPDLAAPARQGERAAVLELLAAAFADYRLDVAGELLPLDERAALAAAEFVGWSCWFLLHRQEPPEAVERCLALPRPPTTAAQHLSADLTLRFLPLVHRRARAVSACDPLTRALEQLLRQWPLSGVLADVLEAPLTPAEFGGHPGLLLLFAERLADNLRPAWVPDGLALEYVELVFEERGLPAAALQPLARAESRGP